ncbi:MAG: TRAM domain-containing protein [Candidatus Bathyarchaeota archaeon]|nr:MAG: TRAM domain-containing protein [Candidatus Bathyarchaeota archaeon]
MGYERRRSFGRGFPPKPVEIGKEYDVKIEEISRRGEGIARIKGLVTFVPNAKAGENVRIRITRISRRFAEAEVVGKATEEAEETVEVAEAAEETVEEPTEAELAEEEAAEEVTDAAEETAEE